MSKVVCLPGVFKNSLQRCFFKFSLSTTASLFIFEAILLKIYSVGRRLLLRHVVTRRDVKVEVASSKSNVLTNIFARLRTIANAAPSGWITSTTPG